MKTALYKAAILSASALVAVIAIAAFPTSTFSATTTVEVNLTVDQDNQDRGDDDDSPSSQTSQTAALMIDIASVDAGQDYVDITWETTVRSQTTVRWSRRDGVDQSYTQASDKTGRTHTTRITGLKSGTQYEIELSAEATNGDTETRREIVQTELPGGPESPAGFRASLTADRNVRLSWQNPQASRFDYVRVTRSDKFFTDEPLRGNLVYEGTGQKVMDTEVAGGDTYFYSIYSRNDAGQWSAPALAAIYVPKVEGAPEDQKVTDMVQDQPEALQKTQDKLADLRFEDLIFSQNGTVLQNDDGPPELAAGRKFSIGLDYEAVPERLKTILVTLTRLDNSKKDFSFVLRADKAKDFYRATIGGLDTVGTHGVEMTILDYKQRRVKTVNGQIAVVQSTSARPAQGRTTVVGQIGDYSANADSSSFVLVLIVLFGFGGLLIAIPQLLSRDAPA